MKLGELNTLNSFDDNLNLDILQVTVADAHLWTSLRPRVPTGANTYANEESNGEPSNEPFSFDQPVSIITPASNDWYTTIQFW